MTTMVERYFYKVCNGLFALEKTEGIVVYMTVADKTNLQSKKL